MKGILPKKVKIFNICLHAFVFCRVCFYSSKCMISFSDRSCQFL
jgi:hypothetical protein